MFYTIQYARLAKLYLYLDLFQTKIQVSIYYVYSRVNRCLSVYNMLIEK